MLPLVLALIACQEPFGTDRHDLEGFRIAAVRAVIDDGTVHARAAVVVDGRPYSDAPVDLRWYWTTPSDVADLDPSTPADATGPAPTLPVDGDVLGLVATSPDGVVRRAYLALGTRLDLRGVDVSVVDDVHVSELSDVSTPTRDAWAASPADHVPEDGVARLTADVPGDARLRWMTVGGAGTFLELTSTVTDWATGELLLDDGEFEERDPLPPGPVTLVALAVDGTGGTDFRATELWVGPPEPGVRVAGRWLASDTAHTGPVTAVLLADDDAPTGLRLADVRPPADGDPAEAPCGPGGPFDPSWLLDQRCVRAELDGVRVPLVIQ